MLLIAAIILLVAPISIYASDAPVVINEFMVDADTEWVELYSEGESLDFITEYWIDDDTDFQNDSGSAKKKQLSGVSLDRKPFIFLDFSSFFNNSGDSVVLFDSSGNSIDQTSYDSNPGKDISIGRSPDKTGSFGILSHPSKGLPNAPVSTPTPTVTPLPSDTPTPTKTPIPTKTPTPDKTATPIPTEKEKQKTPSIVMPSITSAPSKRPTVSSERKSVLGEHTDSIKDVYEYESQMTDENSMDVESTKSGKISNSVQVKWIFLLTGIAALSGSAISGYMMYRKNIQLHGIGKDE